MNDKQIMWILVGAPGSGKSTFRNTLLQGNPNAVCVCPDDNRRALGGDSNNQAVSPAAFAMAKRQVQTALESGKSVIFDATNMYRKARKDFINIARGRGAEVNAVVFECTKELLLQRNAKRGSEGGRCVSEEVIDNMLARYQRPDTTEFDNVRFVGKLGI